MSDPITKAVKIISAANYAARKQLKSFVTTLSNPESPKTAIVVLICSTMVGIGCMGIIERKREVSYLNDLTSEG
jgi:hypothetical protein